MIKLLGTDQVIGASKILLRFVLLLMGDRQIPSIRLTLIQSQLPFIKMLYFLGFTPDVKVWEVLFDKSRNFKSAKRAYDLKGHKAGLLSIAFSADSSRIASLSKDSTWKLWKTNGMINLF